MNSKQILTDSINDLNVIDRLIERNRIEDAKVQLAGLFGYAGTVKGGDTEIRSMMDMFQVEFSKRYITLYS